MSGARPRGYVDRLSGSPGEVLTFRLDCPVEAEARVVRLLDAPGRQGERHEEAVSGIERQRVDACTQTTPLGSCMVASDLSVAAAGADGISIAAWLSLTLLPPRGAPAGVMTVLDAEGRGLALAVNDAGQLTLLAISPKSSDVITQLPLPRRAPDWCLVGAAWSVCQAECSMFVSWEGGADLAKADSPPTTGPPKECIVAALGLARSNGRVVAVRNPLDGRVASPAIWNAVLDLRRLEAMLTPDDVASVEPAILAAAWDFAPWPHTAKVVDRSPHGVEGTLINAPTRGMPGPSETEPGRLSAIHFHHDDLEDAQWQASLEVDLPQLEPGAYALAVVCETGEDRIPFVVTPRRGERRARIAVVLPTFTYLAYANRKYTEPDRAVLADKMASLGRSLEFNAAEREVLASPELGLSLYDRHADGSAVVYASLLRPLLDLRPDYVNSLIQAPRHFPADLRLLDWLRARGEAFDVLTDHDIQEWGSAALSAYRVVLTGSHPEYCTAELLDAFEGHVDRGGNLIYLGGNGFFWVTAASVTRPHLIEVRRPELDPAIPAGLSLACAPGGLWDNRGRPPERLTGVRTRAWGLGNNQAGLRTPASYRAEFAWVFRGIDTPDGTFGARAPGGGAFGDEIDGAAADEALPGRTTVLASSQDEHDDYVSVDIAREVPEPKRADLTITQRRSGATIMSTGSIAWCFALVDETVSRVTENVLRRLMR